MNEPLTVGLAARIAVVAALLAGPAAASDWPMYRADAARSAWTDDVLPGKLELRWSHRAAQPPDPAWPGLQRMTFDRALQPVIAGGILYYGGSADGKVVALDAGSGEPCWSFFTEGPVRFAPAVFEDRVLVGSDDGTLYCLAAADGTLLWKVLGGPDHRKVLGNQHMISLWPVRGGPVVRDGVVYFSAGIWPTEGIFVHALDARTGERIWLDEDSGSIYMPQPHGGANAESGVAAQGHLVATEEHLLVPNGRAVPAAFDRERGEFQYFHLQQYGQRGGTGTMASGKLFFNSGLFFEAKTGSAQGETGGGAIAGLPDGVVTAGEAGLAVYQWQENEAAPGTRMLAKTLSVENVFPARSIAVAGRHAAVGGRGTFTIVDLEEGRRTCTKGVEGGVYGLAVADGKLFVSTTAGLILCYGEETGDPAQEPGMLTAEDIQIGDPLPDDLYKDAALEILGASGVREGYCLDVGCGGGELSTRLWWSLMFSERGMSVVALDSDPEAVAEARAEINAGLYGRGIAVHHASLQDLSDYPPYFADLIVSGRSITEGAEFLDLDQLRRLLRPRGGVLCVGRPGEMYIERRGPLEGEGSWTHQYASAANPACSTDEVRGPLGMLWYRDVDQAMTQRHGRGPSPLCFEGRIYSLGLDSLVAVDAYNGRTLWEVPFEGILRAYDGDHLMGTAGTQSPYCVAPEGVYVRRGNRCTRLDPKSGTQLGRFHAPGDESGEPGIWGWVACEGGILYGSLADPEHVVTYRYVEGGDLSMQLTESTALFAMDAEQHELKWIHRAEHSIRHNAITAGDGRVYFIDRPLADFDRIKDEPRGEHPTGALLCLDGSTGEVLWEQRENVWGTTLALSTEHDSLLMCYQPTRFALTSEVGGRMAVFDAGTGERRWEAPASYASRPLINDRTLYAQGGAWDLLSGDAVPFEFSRSYGCGILAGGRNLLVYRSATLGYMDLLRPSGTQNYGGIRPGCWINAIPAAGLVLVPEGTAGCVCSYPNRAWIALRSDDLRPPLAEPAGGAFSRPLEVELSADQPEVEIRYTLDGSHPTGESPLYRRPILLAESAELEARAFREGAAPSRVASFDYLIDPHLLPLDGERWRVWDVGGEVASAPSHWRVAGEEVVQSSNIFLPPPEVGEVFERPYSGSLRIFEGGEGFADGELRLELRTTDDDGLGVAFRLRDERHHYLFHMDRQRGHRVLARRDGDEYEILAADRVAYLPNRWYDLRVSLDGPEMAVSLDGQEILRARDRAFRRGTVALHCWGSQTVRYRRMAFEPR